MNNELIDIVVEGFKSLKNREKADFFQRLFTEQSISLWPIVEIYETVRDSEIKDVADKKVESDLACGLAWIHRNKFKDDGVTISKLAEVITNAESLFTDAPISEQASKYLLEKRSQREA